MLVIYLCENQGTARLMVNSFASTVWMMPFSKYCKADNIYWKHFSGGRRRAHQTYECDENEFQVSYSGWATNIVNIEVPSARGRDFILNVCCVVDDSLRSCMLSASYFHRI